MSRTNRINRACLTALGTVAIICVSLSCSDSSSPGPTEEAVVAVTAPGAPDGTPNQAVVPTTGGSVVSIDGRLTIEVPPGALTASQTISIQPITNTAPGGAGLSYRLGPAGQTFASPVKVTFKYSDEDIAGSEALALVIATQDVQGRWQSPKNITLNEVAKTVTIETTHFSDWSMLRGWQLRPPSATVAPGRSIDLTIVTCASGPNQGDELSNLIFTCVPDPDFFTVEYWTANGITNGNSVHGRVFGGGNNFSSARYDAPNNPPPNNPVNVAARAREKSGRTTLLISSITVSAHPPYDGTVTLTSVDPFYAGDVITSTAQVTFTYNEEEGFYTPSSGTLNGKWDQVNVGGAACEIHYDFSSSFGPNDGFLLIADGLYIGEGTKFVTATGTTTCNSSGTVQPITTQNVPIQWWKMSAMGTIFMALKPDNKISDNVMNLLAGRRFNVTWSFTPRP